MRVPPRHSVSIQMLIFDQKGSTRTLNTAQLARTLNSPPGGNKYKCTPPRVKLLHHRLIAAREMAPTLFNIATKRFNFGQRESHRVIMVKSVRDVSRKVIVS